MKLSEQLQAIHDSGDVGRAIEGLAEIAEDLELNLFYCLLNDAQRNGISYEKAVIQARQRVEQITQTAE